MANIIAMEYIIKLTPDELTPEIIEQVKQLLTNGKTFEITLTLKEKSSNDYLFQEPQEAYRTKLDRAIDDAENNRDLISFTAEEFERFAEAMELKKSLSKK